MVDVKFANVGKTQEVWRQENVYSDEHGRKITSKIQLVGPAHGQVVYTGQVIANFGPAGQATVSFELLSTFEDLPTGDILALFEKYDQLGQIAVVDFAKKMDERRREQAVGQIIDVSKGVPPIPPGFPNPLRKPFRV